MREHSQNFITKYSEDGAWELTLDYTSTVLYMQAYW